MKGLIKGIAQALVDNPEQVSVREINSAPLILYNSCLYLENQFVIQLQYTLINRAMA